MFALYIDDAGTDAAKRFDVVRLLTAECCMPFADVKLVLAGIRVKVMARKVSEVQSLRDKLKKLENLGASAVIELCPEEDQATH